MNAMVPPRSPGDDLDLLAVSRDAHLVDQLAQRASVTEDDAVVRLLAALAADVDHDLDAMLIAHEDETLTRATAALTLLPAPRPGGTGYGLRATTVAVVVGATLCLGGVAAAVTGDPLAPVKGIYAAVAGDHPGQEAKRAALEAGRAAQRQIRSGDLSGARASLDAMAARLGSEELSGGDRRSVEARLAGLEARLERAADKADRADRAPGSGAGQVPGKVPGEGGGTGPGKGAGPGSADADRTQGADRGSGSGSGKNADPGNGRGSQGSGTSGSKGSDTPGGKDADTPGRKGSGKGAAERTPARPRATAQAQPAEAGDAGSSTSTDDGSTDDGSTDDGKADDGKADDGKADDGKDDDGKDDGSTDVGAARVDDHGAR